MSHQNHEIRENLGLDLQAHAKTLRRKAKNPLAALRLGSLTLGVRIFFRFSSAFFAEGGTNNVMPFEAEKASSFI